VFMSCCGSKTLDGLDSGAAGGTFDGDIIINGGIVTSGDGTIGGDLLVAGDLNVQGGDFELGVGIDGWSNVRSASAAFGLDLEAPAGKRVRIVNDVTPIVEVDTKLRLNASTTGQVAVVPAAVSTSYDFVLPTNLGLNTQVLTTTGTSTYWSAGGGVGGGTVTSVALNVAGTPFLTVSGSPITTAGTFMLTFSGTALDVVNGGTGVTTATGTGSVVRSIAPSLVTPNIGAAVGLRLDLTGSTSGTVSILVRPVAGTYNFNLPITAGSAGQVLTSAGGGSNEMTWTTPAAPGTGTVTSVAVNVAGTPFLSVSGSPITSSGTFTFTFSGSALDVVNGGTGTTTSTGTAGSVVLSISPTITGTLTVEDVSASGVISTSDTTSSISTTTGSGVFAGGLGVAGNINMGGTLTSPNILGSGQISAQGQLKTTATTASTSTTTGSLVSGGGAGIGGDLFVRQSVNVNYGGSTGSPQLRISPATTNSLATVAFYTGTSNSGDSWVVGHAGGAGNFLIRSTASGQDKLFITPSGPVFFLSGASTVSFLNVTGSTSGTVSIQAQANAGTWNFNLPITAGSAGQVLTSAGGGGNVMTWSSASTGTVTSVGMTVPAFLTVSGSPITTAGSFTVGLSGTALPVLNGGTGVTTSTGTGSVVLNTSPTLTGAILTTPTLTNPTSNNIGLQGGSGGVVSILPPSALFSSWNFNLPTTAGVAGQVLQSQGGGGSVMTWANVGTGSVTSVGLAVPAFLNVSGSPIVSSGVITIGLSGTALPILNGGTSTTTATGIVGSPVVLQNGPTITGNMNVNNILGIGSIQMNSGAVLSGAALNQFNTSGGGNGYIASFLNSGLLADNAIFMMLGRSTGDAAVLSYNRAGVNPLSFGIQFFGGSGNSVLVYQNNTASSSTTTGSLVVTGTGGLGVGGGITSSSTRIRGVASQQTISPLTLNSQTSVKFYTNVNETGASWGIGLNANGAGGDIFCIESSTAGGNLVTISPAGGMNVPAITSSGIIKTTNTTASTSTVTGSGQFAGGVGIGGALNAGGVIKTTDTTVSTNASTGSGVFAGGLGVGGAINSTGTVTATTTFAQSNTASPFTFTNTTTGASNAFIVQSNLAPNVANGADIYQAIGGSLATNNALLFGLKKRASQYATFALYGDDETMTLRNINTPSTTTTTGTLQVKGGLGVDGRVCANELQTDNGFPFRYREGFYNATLSAGPLTFSVNPVSSPWTRVGRLVTVIYANLCNIGSAGDPGTFTLRISLPFTPLGYACGGCAKVSDTKPGQGGDKAYTVEAQPGIPFALFYNATTGFSAYEEYPGNISWTNFRMYFTLTYITSDP
jgi:hypothetical protein